MFVVYKRIVPTKSSVQLDGDHPTKQLDGDHPTILGCVSKCQAVYESAPMTVSVSCNIDRDQRNLDIR